MEDHCRGIELVLGGGIIGETYNIGGNNEWRNLAIVERLCDCWMRALPQTPTWHSVFPPRRVPSAPVPAS